ncbi:MAG TPA: FadR family transcriptional regulator [Christensenellaceae bacterium]|nr:FadR family transcriptional regulator [Christensenellaceae bacterium]
MKKITFKKLGKMRLSDQIVDEICKMIANNELKMGDQLPPERDLAEMLGVSRLPLREALKALEATSVIDSRMGGGYYVRGLDIAHLVNALNMNVSKSEEVELLREMKEARRLLEIGAIELACQRRNQEDIAEMEIAIKRMEFALDKGDITSIMSTSIEFHACMVKAAHNTLLDNMMACLYNSIVADRINTYEKQPERYSFAPEDHRNLLQKIIERDIITAKELLKEHLRDAY